MEEPPTEPLHKLPNPIKDKEEGISETTIDSPGPALKGDPADGAELEDTEDVEVELIVLDSFVSLVEALDSLGVQLIEGEYHLRGSISDESLEKLAAYAQTICCFTLTDKAPTLLPETLLRLVQILAQHHSRKNIKSIFPKLDEFYIENANTTLALLPLFATSPIEWLEIHGVSKAKRNTILTFLHTVAEEACGLTKIVLDNTIPYDSSMHQACMRFSKLTELHLAEVGPVIHKTMLEEIGRLPLIDLRFGARCTDYIRQNVDAQAKSSEGGRTSEAHLSTSSPYLITADKHLANPASAELGFAELQKLLIIAKIDVMTDLADLIGSEKLAEVSLTLIGTTRVHLPTVDVTTKAKQNNVLAVQASNNAVSESRRFHNVLQKILAAGLSALTKVEIFASSLTPTGNIYYETPILGSYSLKALLSQPTLHTLTISLWKIRFNLEEILSHLTTLPQPSNLETLKITVAGGISLSVLRTILTCCPSMADFHCLFNLNNVPPFPNDGIAFDLETSGAGSIPFDAADNADPMDVAQYIDALCPNLESIEVQTNAQCNPEKWKKIHNLIKMCQRSRSYHATAQVKNSGDAMKL
ncbi:hypothetical protein BDN70DRAFT_872726 [Pholiota conissans]|uniref:Uncharacterized protein n=1 Tax=Pholiota conissans TaxID=109636 RepID=A0A9P6D574_9AGAR|nr:hypothetical protein BDN70DRAFT_872726 [Pholiota conissans]